MTEARHLKLTFDTNCINLLKRKRVAALTELEKLAHRGLIEISSSPAMLDDLDRDPTYLGRKRREKAAAMPQHSPGTALMLGRSGLLGVNAFLDGPPLHNYIEPIRGLLFPRLKSLIPRQESDVLHLAYHILNQADIFVTSDQKDILSKRDELAKRFRIEVCTPEEALVRVMSALKEQSNPGS